MFQKILVPLDGSRLGEMALPYAEELAGKLGAEIILLSVAASPGAREYHNHEIYITRIVTETRHNARKFLVPGGGEVKVRALTLVGHPAEEIVAYAERSEIGLIIMVTHGHSGIRRRSLGSVADKVVRAAQPPVALIRAKRPREARGKGGKGMFHSVLALLDGSAQSEVSLPYVEEMGHRLLTRITFLQAVPQPYFAADAQSYLNRICQRFRAKGIEAGYQVKVGDPADESARLAEEVDADLVVMAAHGRSGIGQWMLGSVAERVLQSGSTPVLLIRS